MQIKLEQYKIFNECATTLSFSEAAKHLYITQSAVSQSMTALENELKTKLFIRHPRGVLLTKEGEMLFKWINEALTMITHAENELSNLKDLQAGELSIGAGDSICHYYLMPYLVKFHELYPDVKIRVFNGTSYETVKLLKSGQLDLAFINFPYKDESLTMVTCEEIQDIFISGEKDDHVYTYEELASENLILLETLSNSRQYIDRWFSKNGVLLHPEMELGAYELLSAFTKNKLGISCVIKEFSKELLDNEDVYELNITPPIPKRSFGYAYLTRVSLSAAALKFTELLKKGY